MRILVVRHAEPDYENDSLTDKGWREAEYLADRLSREKIDYFYVSPMGRAQATASCTLKKMKREAVTLDWLKEFHVPVIHPGDTLPTRPWDWIPSTWVADERFFDKDHWTENPAFEAVDLKEKYDHVVSCFDELLASHGYQRNGYVYDAICSNHDTIALFCHFGLECVLLSHLLNVSPMVLWHGFCAAPSSVTTIYTEEREKGTASFRISSFGDISHLYVHHEKPSFMARYCECFDDPVRHD